MLSGRCDRKKFLFARELRRRMTPAERILWEELRRKSLGVRFRRQCVILGFIADFYCPSRRLVIEVDGPSHIGRETRDARRDQAMKRHEITTLRFTNEQVEEEPWTVLARIREAIRTLPVWRPIENLEYAMAESATR